MAFETEVSQWVLGYLVIAITIVAFFYIFWYRSLKNDNFRMGASSVALALLFEGVSVVAGYIFYGKADVTKDPILSTFCLLPIVAVSFGAFYGIWKSNDFNALEANYTMRKNMSAAEI